MERSALAIPRASGFIGKADRLSRVFMNDTAVTQLKNQRASRDFLQQGANALQDKRFEEARNAFEKALSLDRDCVEAYLALARMRFPGQTYLDILSRIHRLLRPKTYVEIGVGSGASLSRVLPSTQSAGIDPQPCLTEAIPSDARLILLRSEDVFGAADPSALLGFGVIDLGFVDGMHLFENVLDDFNYIERHASPTGVILIHDCLPFDAVTSSRERSTRFWTGDVWRVLPTLRKFRPDLEITVVECAPSGLAIVRKLDPRSHVIERERANMLSYGHALALHAPLGTFGVRLLPNDWGGIERLLKTPAS